MTNPASPTQHEIETGEVTCANSMPAFAAWPRTPGKYPVIVLMHERYGLVQHTRDQAMRCARDGFAVIAPDFFFRHPEPDVLHAGDSRYDMTDPESVELIDASFDTAAGIPGADMDRKAVAGYCQTGRHPLVYASRRQLDAAVVWYGAASKREWPANTLQPKPLEEVIAAIECPVFGAFGEADHIISVDNVLRFRNACEAARVSFDIHIYAGAPHGWLNDTMPGRYRETQAKAAWAHQQAFLAEVLAPAYDAGKVTWRFESEISRDYDFSRNVRLE